MTTLVSASTGSVTPPTAALFGLFMGVAGAATLAIAARWAGFPLTPVRGASYAFVGLVLAYVAGRGLLLAS